MNARLVRLALTICLASTLNLTVSLQAQDTNPTEAPQPAGDTNNGETQQPGTPGRRGGFGTPPGGFFGSGAGMEAGPAFDIQIEDGKLSLAPLAGHSEMTNFWAAGTKEVPATMENISRYLRATDPHLNVILSPGTGGVTISNLKIKTILLPSVSDAITIASGNTIRGNGGFRGRGGFVGPNGGRQPGESSITFTSRESESQPTLEVFNLSGYIQTLGKVDEKVVQQKLDELQLLIMNTLRSLDKSSAEAPNFKFHSGTKLLIVVGKPEAIEVTRKIVNALSGQQKNGAVDLLETIPPSGQN